MDILQPKTRLSQKCMESGGPTYTYTIQSCGNRNKRKGQGSDRRTMSRKI